MMHFSKELLTNARHAPTYGKWHREQQNERKFADTQEARVLQVNQAAILPRDAWIEMDAITTRVMRGDGGSVFMNDLMPLAKAQNIGKMVSLHRISSDAGSVTRSLSGQVAVPVDKTQYKYSGAPVGVFASGYYRNFREWEAFQYEGFDALFDDQENILFNLRKDMADYVLNGDPNFNVENYQGYGIKNHPGSQSINLGSAAGGAGIDLTTATPTAILAFFDQAIQGAFDANFLEEFHRVNFYVSPAIMRNLEQNLSSPEGFKGGTLRDAIEAKRRIGAIKQTFELVGNEFIAFVPDSRFIRPIIGQAMTTVAKPRFEPRANYVFDVWGAMGLEIKVDWNGRGGVFHSVVQN